MNRYLVPANTKKSALIMGFMRPEDLIIGAVGIIITIIWLIIVGNIGNDLSLLLACMPAAVCCVLILPIPNYHNTRVAIASLFRFYFERRNYIWKGWCIYDAKEK